MKLSAELKAFEKRLGYHFQTPKLLSEAVTHASMSTPNRDDNQRLEFLGDRVLGLVMAVTVTGLKITGLILIVALLIIPPVAARFWTERASTMTTLSAGIGGLSGYTGAALSAAAPNLPTGPIIVLSAFAMFATSLVCAPARGLLAASLRRHRLRRGT